jgi:ketosteroid isomerase-like protein
MSQENVEIVRTAIEAFNRGDNDGVVADFAPDCELDLSRAPGPVHGVYPRDQFWEAVDELVGIWASVRIEPHEFIEAGEQVVVPWTAHFLRPDGIEVRAGPTWTFTIRDGAIEHICMYQERQEALEAAGLEE